MGKYLNISVYIPIHFVDEYKQFIKLLKEDPYMKEQIKKRIQNNELNQGVQEKQIVSFGIRHLIKLYNKQKTQ